MAQHTYSAPGEYTIRLEIRDSGGIANSTTRIVLVENTPPIATFLLKNCEGDFKVECVVDASSSSDLEDVATSLEVRWDWENDGIWDADWSSLKVTSHQYAVTGTYTIRMEVRDSGGLAASTSKSVHIQVRSDYSLALFVLAAIVATVAIVILTAIYFSKKKRAMDETRSDAQRDHADRP